MTTITTDFAPGDSTAVVNTKLSTIAQYWGGASALTGVTTYGGVRTVLNGFANAANQIADQELGASFITKLNWLNNIDDVVDGGLFATSEPGVWFDPSDLTTLFQNTNGTTPVTTPGQTVGLMLDKSQGVALGPQLVTNGDFSAGTTGWPLTSGTATVTASGGGLTVNASVTAFVAQSFSTVVGGTYSYSVEIVSQNGAAFNAIRKADNNTASVNPVELRQGIANGPGTSTGLFVATASTTFIVIQANTGAIITVDNISVQLLPGNHATQATAASRPTYGIVPLGGRRNELLGTSFGGAVVGTPGTAPTSWSFNLNGGSITSISDEVLGFSATAARQIIGQIVNIPATGTTTLSVTVVSNPDGLVFNQLFTIISAPAGISTSFRAAGVTVSASTYVPLAGERLEIIITSGGTAGGSSFRIGVGASGVATGSASFEKPQFETGSTATAYQRVTTQFDVTETGVASLSYLSFDGVDDGMVTPTITPGIDKVQVFAGVRKLSDAAIGIIYESSANSGTNAGSIQLYNALDRGIQGRARGSNDVSMATSDIGAAPLNFISTLQGDISGDASSIRINGVVRASSTSDQGTGNYLAYPLYIGRRGGTTLPFNGQIYSLIVRFGTNLTTPQISQWENFTNAKTGAY